MNRPGPFHTFLPGYYIIVPYILRRWPVCGPVLFFPSYTMGSTALATIATSAPFERVLWVLHRDRVRTQTELTQEPLHMITRELCAPTNPHRLAATTTDAAPSTDH